MFAEQILELHGHLMIIDRKVVKFWDLKSEIVKDEEDHTTENITAEDKLGI